MRPSAIVAIAVALVFACSPSTPEEKRRAAIHEVERRVLAPCCWMGTIDVHESPVSHELREEVARRVTAGEAPDRIVDDLAARYGDRVRATPPGGGLPTFLYAGGALAFLLAGVIALRWVRRGRRNAALADRPAAPGRIVDERLEDQLDEELAKLD